MTYLFSLCVWSVSPSESLQQNGNCIQTPQLQLEEEKEEWVRRALVRVVKKRMTL